MKERPILEDTDMVKAILEGRKTQMRRVLDNTHPVVTGFVPNGYHGYWQGTAKSEQVIDQYISTFPFTVKCPFGVVGDRLWVREAFVPDPSADSDHWNDEDSLHTYYSWDGCGSKVSELPKALKTNKHVFYKASTNQPELWSWTPNYRMPRWASRILLEITGIRVERLNDISESDCLKEGIVDGCCLRCRFEACRCEDRQPDLIQGFAKEWSDVNGFFPSGGKAWRDNPWVWVIDFKVAKVGGRK